MPLHMSTHNKQIHSFLSLNICTMSTAWLEADAIQKKRQTKFLAAAARVTHALFVTHDFEEVQHLFSTDPDLGGQDLAYVMENDFEAYDVHTVPGAPYSSLLLCAVEFGDLAAATFLLDHGYDPNRMAWDIEAPPLIHLAHEPELPNAPAMFTLLLNRGANLHAKADDEVSTAFNVLQRALTEERPPQHKAAAQILLDVIAARAACA